MNRKCGHDGCDQYVRGKLFFCNKHLRNRCPAVIDSQEAGRRQCRNFGTKPGLCYIHSKMDDIITVEWNDENGWPSR